MKRNRLTIRLITFIGVALLLLSCFFFVWSTLKMTEKKMIKIKPITYNIIYYNWWIMKDKLDEFELHTQHEVRKESKLFDSSVTPAIIMHNPKYPHNVGQQ